MLAFLTQKSKFLLSGFSGKRAFGLILLLLVLAFGSCNIFNQTHEYERFIHCRFSVKETKVLSVAGIDVSHLNKYSDLDIGQLITLGIQLIKGDLPSIMQITVEGNNSSTEKAAISGMDWLLLMKSDTLAKGTINQPITIPPGKTVNFPVKVNFNLTRLIKSGSLEQIMKVTLENNSKEKLEKLNITFKFKPWYYTGNKIKKSPVYFSIHPEFNQMSR